MPERERWLALNDSPFENYSKIGDESLGGDLIASESWDA